MPVLRLLLNGSVATLLMAAAALTATAQEQPGRFPKVMFQPAAASSRLMQARARNTPSSSATRQPRPQLPNARNDALDVVNLRSGL
jgi:hypothetical protein